VQVQVWQFNGLLEMKLFNLAAHHLAALLRITTWVTNINFRAIKRDIIVTKSGKRTAVYSTHQGFKKVYGDGYAKLSKRKNQGNFYR
jgi:hypothetical protein